MRNFISQIWQWVCTHKALVAVIAFILALDRVTKSLTLAYLDSHDGIIVAPFLYLRYVQNTGAAFGILQNGNLLLIIITVLIIGYLLKNWQEFCAAGPWVKWGLVFILGGALGNLYDRITLGFVVDFIDLRVWPVFNVADSFITVGAILLGASLLFSHDINKPEEK